MFCVIWIRLALARAIIGHLMPFNQSTSSDVIANSANVCTYPNTPPLTPWVRNDVIQQDSTGSCCLVGYSAKAFGTILDLSSLTLYFLFSLLFKKILDL